MLGNAPYYYNTTPKIIAAFGWIFQDITIERKNPNGTVKSIKVPIELTSKEKWAQRLISDPNAGNESKQRHVSLILPRMGYELTTFRYDPTRKLSPIYFRVAPTDSNTLAKKQLNPIPMIFSFSLYLQTRTLEDAYMIMEQFLPFFQPDFTIPIIDIPDIDLKRDIIFSLINSSNEDSYEGNFLDRRVISWQFDFEARAHMYPPVKEKKIITEADVVFNDMDTVTWLVDPPTANIDQPFTPKEVLSVRDKKIYYIDPINGNDNNSGLTTTLPWKTLAKADTVTLKAGDTIMFRGVNGWTPYRYLGMTADATSLTADVITVPADKF